MNYFDHNALYRRIKSGGTAAVGNDAGVQYEPSFTASRCKCSSKRKQPDVEKNSLTQKDLHRLLNKGNEPRIEVQKPPVLK